MTYAVKELFYTLQGEGANAARPAVFCRFAGATCGRNARSTARRRSAVFATPISSAPMARTGASSARPPTWSDLARRFEGLWPDADRSHRFVVLTGGEPLLQVDPPLLSSLRELGFESAVETNGTALPPPGIVWLCVSPKAGSDWILRAGNGLKLVWPQRGFDLEGLAARDRGVPWG